jgi:uncharacterized protein (DUF58 family)
VALLPFALSDWLPGLGWLSVALGAGLVGLFVADYRATAPPERLDVTREVAERLSLGVENAVTLAIRNGGPRALALQAREPLTVAARPGETVRLRYGVVPPRRGDWQFGRVVVRYASVLGLFRRQHAYPCERTLKVYPNLRDLQRYELLARRGLQTDAGTRAARRFGPGTEFERLREYVPDDELRRVNWKATARRGVPISAEYETERSQNVLIVLDAGRLMGALSDDLTKLDHALNAGLLLAYAASRRGDRVGMLAYADRVRAFLPPQRGRRAFLGILEVLYRLQAEPTEADHARAFAYLAGRNLRRSLLVLFTDVTDPDVSRALLAHLGRAARHHLAVLVTVSDPSVTAPAERTPTTSQGLYEKMVAQRLLDERRQVLATLEGRGVVTLDLPADKLSAQVVAAYLELKARGRL